MVVAAPTPPPCNINTSIPFHTVQYVFPFDPAGKPESNLVGFHHAVVVVGIGILEPIGILLNLFSLIVFCYDKLNRGSAVFILQALCIIESFYLIFNFFGTFLPGLVYYKTSDYKVESSCVPKGDVDIYASGRVWYNRLFTLLLDGADSAVVWMTLLVLIYSLFPLCCFKSSKTRIFNHRYAILDVIIVSILVLCLNFFTYICAPNKLDYTLPDSCSSTAMMFDGMIRNQLLYLLPALAALILYMCLSVQLYILKGTSMDPRETNLMTQLLRAYAISSMFLLCEVITFIWLIQGHALVLRYLALLCKHINCSMKFFVYLGVGQEFRTIVKSIFTKRMDDLEFHWEQQEMRPVDAIHKEMHMDPDGHTLPHYDEVCAVTHQVTVV